METVFVKAKKWGNSVGVILPKELDVKPNQEVELRIIKKPRRATAGAAWGLLKHAKADTKKILDELNEEPA